PPVHDVVGHVSDQAILTKGIGPQANKRLGDAHSELNRDDARRIVHDRVEVRRRPQVFGHRAWRSTRLRVDDLLCNHLSHHQGIGMLVVAQVTGLILVKVQGTEPGRTLSQWKSEYGPDA